MVNYIFNVTGLDEWFEIAKKLKDNSISKPVLWFGNDKISEKLKLEFGENIISANEFVHYPYLLKGTDYNSSYAKYFESTEYLNAKDRCIKMMDRIDNYGQFSRLDREVYFHQLAIKFVKIIYDLNQDIKTKPNLFLTVENPHSHAQYLLYSICSFFQIPTFKFNNWALAPLIFIENISTGERFKHNLKIKEEDNNVLIIEKLISNFIDGLSKGNSTYEFYYMKIQKDKRTFLTRIKTFLLNEIIESLKELKINLSFKLNSKYYPINPYKLGFLTRSFIKNQRRKNLNKKLSSSFEKTDINNKYIYFPLHFEPERTTNPDGGDFQDQFLALLKLRNIIPEEIFIYLKEHPSLHYISKKAVKGRSPLFYDLIKNVKNVKIINIETDSKFLIKNSHMVGTITGSVALEASVMGKKTIVLGNTWYEEFPNTFNIKKWKNYESINKEKLKGIDEILDFIKNLKNQFSIIGFQNPSQKKHFENILDVDSAIIKKNLYFFLNSFFKEFDKNNKKLIKK